MYGFLEEVCNCNFILLQLFGEGGQSAKTVYCFTSAAPVWQSENTLL